ncbi:MAG: chemotaxis protein CheC [Thermoplasmatota archaeon]
MPNEVSLSDSQEKRLRELLRTAGQKAGDSLSMMISDSVETEIVDFYDTPSELHDKTIEDHEIGAIVYTKLKEGEGGIAFFTLYEDSAQSMANILLMRDQDYDFGDLGEDEIDALGEVGNIVLGSFLSELADFFRTEILFDPPKAIPDEENEGYKKIIGDSFDPNQVFLIADLRFYAKDVPIDGQYVIIPSDELMDHFIDYMS